MTTSIRNVLIKTLLSYLVFYFAIPSWGQTPSSLWTRKKGEDWPAFLGPRGDGTSSEKGINAALWKPHPKILWTKDLGVSYGGPTIVGGRMLQFDRFGNKERLTCFHAETGKELWRLESTVNYDDMYGYNNGPRCSPVVDEDRVYTYGVTGHLVCSKLANGKLVWEKDTTREYGVVQNFFGVASTPFIYENLVLVMVGGSPKGTTSLDKAKPNGTAVVAFDKLTGKEVYRVGNDLASYSSIVVRTIEGKPTGLAFLRGGLMGFDPKKGEVLFEFPWRSSMMESVNAAVPVTRDDSIFISETYEIGSALLSIKGRKPTVTWKDSGNLRQHAFRAHWSTPVWVGGYLFGCSGRNQPDSDFRCISMKDGKLAWADRRHERSSVLLVDDHLIVLGELGRLELMRPNPEKLDVLAECDLNQELDPVDQGSYLEPPCWAAPVFSHGLLYIRGNTKLLCIDVIPE